MIVGESRKLGVGEPTKFSVGVVKLGQVNNHIGRNHPLKQSFHVTEILFGREADFYHQNIGAFFHYGGIVTGSTQGFKDQPKLWQGVRQFFI